MSEENTPPFGSRVDTRAMYQSATSFKIPMAENSYQLHKQPSLFSVSGIVRWSLNIKDYIGNECLPCLLHIYIYIYILNQ